jgi:hypothetical protein
MLMGIFNGKKRIDDHQYENKELIIAVNNLRLNFVDLDYVVKRLHQCDTEDKEVAAEKEIGRIRVNLHNTVAELDRIVGIVPNIVYEDSSVNGPRCLVERTAAEIRNTIIFCNEMENGIGPGHGDYNSFMWEYIRVNMSRTSLAKFNRDNILLSLVFDKRSGRSWLMIDAEWNKLCCG